MIIIIIILLIIIVVVERGRKIVIQSGNSNNNNNNNIANIMCARRSVPGGGVGSGYFHCQGVVRARSVGRWDGGAVLCNNSRSLTRRARQYARNLTERFPSHRQRDDGHAEKANDSLRAHIYTTTFGRGNHLSIGAPATPLVLVIKVRRHHIQFLISTREENTNSTQPSSCTISVA